tara:strand:+ start:442 stop:3909 length:3468 start_codon:yes stop_codon:yes gene_type:complete
MEGGTTVVRQVLTAALLSVTRLKLEELAKTAGGHAQRLFLHDTRLVFVALVKWTDNDEEGEAAEADANDTAYEYLCLGMHHFTIVSSDLDRVLALFPYSSIERSGGIGYSEKTTNLFSVALRYELEIGAPPVQCWWADDTTAATRERASYGFHFCAENASEIVPRIDAAFRCDWMYREWGVPPSTLMGDTVHAGGSGDPTVDAEQEVVGSSFWRGMKKKPDNEKLERFLGYFFFIPDCFTISKEPSPPTMRRYITSDAEGVEALHARFFEVHVLEPMAIDSMRRTGNQDVKSLCEALVRQTGTTVSEYKIIRTPRRHCPRRFFKRMNLQADVSEYTAWQIHIRTWEARTDSSDESDMGGRQHVRGGDEDAEERRRRRTAQTNACRDIGFLTLRRKFIPPLLDTFQDFCFIEYGARFAWQGGSTKFSVNRHGVGASLVMPISKASYGVTKERVYEDPMPYNEFFETVEGIVDSFSPATRVNEDRNVAQAVCDALQLDEASFFWYQSRICVRPDCSTLLARFVNSIRQCLEQQGSSRAKAAAGISSSVTSSGPDGGEEGVGGESSLGASETPFDVVESMVRLGVFDELGLARVSAAATAASLTPTGNDATSTVAPDVHAAWERRVWRYLSFCVVSSMNGIPGGFAALKEAMRNIRQSDPHNRQVKVVERVLDKMLHMRLRGHAYEWKPLPMRIREMETAGAGQIVFNEAVMIGLLECEFVQTALVRQDGHDSTLLPTLIVRLVQHCTWTARRELETQALQFELGKQIFALSQNVEDSGATRVSANYITAETARTILIPATIEFLRHTRHDEIRGQLVCALTNFAHTSEDLCRHMMQYGVADIAVAMLSSSSADLVRHACRLLINCSNTAYGRRVVASKGAVAPLVALIEGSPMPPHHHALEVLVDVVTVLRNIASDAASGSGFLRDSVVDALELDQRNPAFWAKWIEWAPEITRTGATMPPMCIYAVTELLHPHGDADVLFQEQFEDWIEAPEETICALQMNVLYLLIYFCYNNRANKNHIGKLIADHFSGRAIIFDLLEKIGAGEDTSGFGNEVEEATSADEVEDLLRTRVKHLAVAVLSLVYVLLFDDDNQCFFTYKKPSFLDGLDTFRRRMLRDEVKFIDDLEKERLASLIHRIEQCVQQHWKHKRLMDGVEIT